MKLKIALVAFALALSACGDDDNNHGRGTPIGGGGPGNEELVETTDEGSCNGAPEAGATIYQTWRQRLQGDGVSVAVLLALRPGFLRLTNMCRFADGHSVVATLEVPIADGAGKISILQSAEHTEQESYNGRSYECSVSVRQMTVNYALVGSCLKLSTADGQSTFFIK